MSALREAWQKYEPQIAGWLAKVEQVAEFLATNRTMVALEGHVAGGQQIIEAFGGTAKFLGAVGGEAPLVGQILVAYDVFLALGGRQMDANDVAKLMQEKSGEFPG